MYSLYTCVFVFDIICCNCTLTLKRKLTTTTTQLKEGGEQRGKPPKKRLNGVLNRPFSFVGEWQLLWRWCVEYNQGQCRDHRFYHVSAWKQHVPFWAWKGLEWNTPFQPKTLVKRVLPAKALCKFPTAPSWKEAPQRVSNDRVMQTNEQCEKITSRQTLNQTI